jgi:hypothetical protein
VPRPRQKETQEKRRKYIENRTIGGMNKKDAALNAGFTLAMATNAAGRIETPEVLAAIESWKRASWTAFPRNFWYRNFVKAWMPH